MEKLFTFPILEVFVFCFAGLVLLSIMRTRKRMESIQNWPETGGKVVQSRLKMVNISDPRDFSAAYAAEVRYQYSVNGKKYESSRVSLSPLGYRFYSEKEAQAFLASYNAGQAVKVYYNPDKPGEAVLDIEGVKKNIANQIVILIVGFLVYIIIKLFY